MQEKLSLVTIIVIGLNVLISYKGFNDRQFFERYKFNIKSVRSGEKIRFLSSGFLHVDTMHLLVNMITLYFFTDVILQLMGTYQFILIYLGSLLLGNLFSYYFHKNNPNYTAVGASGAIMGVLYASILLRPNMMLGLFFIIPIPAYIFGIGYLLYSIYGMKKRIGNIGHDAHFGGAMGGYIITLILAPQLFQLHPLMVGLLFIPLVVLFIVYKAKLI